MKILFLLESSETSVYHLDSAVGAVCNTICTDLSTAGHEIYLPTGKFQPEIKINTLSSPNKKTPTKLIKSWIKKLPGYTSLKMVLLHRTKSKKLNEIKNQCLTLQKPDLIISWIGIDSNIGSDLKKHWGIKLISIYDNPLVEEYKEIHRSNPVKITSVLKKEKEILENSDIIIAYSEKMIESLKQKKINIAKYYILQFTIERLMIQEKKHNQINEKINIIYIGSFLPWHRVKEIVIAINQNETLKSQVNLHLVGKGMEYEEIKNLVQTLNADSYIKLYGYLDGDDLKNVLLKMDVGIIPGCLWFHAPIKFIQYCSAGLAIIAPETPTIREMSNFESNIYFFKSQNEILEILPTLIQQRSELKLKGENMRKLFENKFSKTERIDQWSKIFSRLKE